MSADGRPRPRPARQASRLGHFETFEFIQDYPFCVATPVGADSWFVYGLDPVPHAKTGKRTPALRQRIAQRPHRPNRGCVGSTVRTLELLVGCVESGRTPRIPGDGHAAYDAATRRHPRRGPRVLTGPAARLSGNRLDVLPAVPFPRSERQQSRGHVDSS